MGFATIRLRLRDETHGAPAQPQAGAISHTKRFPQTINSGNQFRQSIPAINSGSDQPAPAPGNQAKHQRQDQSTRLRDGCGRAEAREAEV